MPDPVVVSDPADAWIDCCPHVPLIEGGAFESAILGGPSGRTFTAVAFLGHGEASRRMAHALEAVACSGRAVVRMDAEADDVRPLCERFALFAVPALYLFQGGRLKSIFRGKVSPEMIETWIGYEAGPLPRRHG